MKWGVIRRNEKLIIPKLCWEKDIHIAMAFDPSRTGDNSILSAMNLYQHPEYGWCGDIVNCINMIDIASKRGFKLDSNRQIDEIRNAILNYNGQNPDYEYLDCILVDQGAGGGGVSTYADALLNNWKDRYGKEHRGLIDLNHEIYEGYSSMYPDAIDKLRLISPRKFRTQMVEEFIELMNLGVIKFPYEYGNQGYVKVSKGVDPKTEEEIFVNYDLSEEEEISLINIDLMKLEITSIHKSTNPENTSITYALSKEKENKLHDDRFYTIIMLAHRLYELRRGQIINSDSSAYDYVFTYS